MDKEFQANDQQPMHNLLGISIDEEIRRKMYTIITWSRITAVGGFVNIILNILSSIIIFSNAIYRDVSWLVVSSTVSLVISFFLNYFLFLFSRNLKISLDTEDQQTFIIAALQLKNYMRMLGILLVAAALLATVIYGYFFLMGGWRLI